MTLFSKPSVQTRGLMIVPLLVALGCGRTAEVTGKATLNGKPITSGSVTILASDSLTYSGQLNEQGGYEILNVPRGSAKVSIASPDPANIAGQAKAPGTSGRKKSKTPAVPPSTPAGWLPLPAHYADFEKSGLRLEIQGGINMFDIPLVGPPARK
jgi:hypothetical protein